MQRGYHPRHAVYILKNKFASLPSVFISERGVQGGKKMEEIGPIEDEDFPMDMYEEEVVTKGGREYFEEDTKKWTAHIFVHGDD